MIIESQRSFWNDAAPAWAVAIGTFVLAFVAVFQEWLRKLIVRPRLGLDAVVSRPDCQKTITSIGADVYYFRLRIENTGNDAARDVQVYLAVVERQKADKGYRAVARFSPMNLLWSIIRQPTLPILLPGMPPRYCDFAHVTIPRLKMSSVEDLPEVDEHTPVLALDLEVCPNNKGHLLEPGVYRFHLKLAASNHPVRDYTLEVDFKGIWFDNEDKMLSDGFGMHLV